MKTRLFGKILAVGVGLFLTACGGPAPTTGDPVRDAVVPSEKLVFAESPLEYYTRAPGVSVQGALAPESGDLAVVEFGPVGELPVEQPRPTIFVMFNHPVVPLAKLGEPMTSSPVMSLSPAVEGVYRWYGTRVLSFEPNQPLVDKPMYTVTIAGGTASVGGKKLGKPVTFEFHTEPVKIVSLYAGDADNALTSDIPPKQARYLTVEFNQPVDPAVLASFLMVDTGEESLPVKASRPAYPERLKSRAPLAVLLTLASDPPEDAELRVTLRDGAKPQTGFPPRSGDQTLSVHTVRPFALEALSSSAWDLPRSNSPGTVPVYAEFSHPLTAAAAKASYPMTVNRKRVFPASVEVFGRTLRLNLSGLQPGDTVSFQAPVGLEDVYGRKLPRASNVETTEIPAPYAYVDFPSSWSGGLHHLEAAFSPQFVYEARNLTSLAVGTASAPAWDFGAGFARDKSWPNPAAVDMAAWAPHKVRYSLVDLKPLLSAGFGTAYFHYQAAWKDGKQRETENGRFAIQVTDIGITTRFAANRVLVWANRLSTGLPLVGATVLLGGASSGPQATTDAQGLAVIPLAPGAFVAQFGNGDDTYVLPISVLAGKDRADFRALNTQPAWNGSTYGHDDPDEVEERRDRTFLFTDRGLYKPGETLALRGIDWEQELAGFSPYNGTYTLVLEDPQYGKELWRVTGTASANGGFAHQLVLPAGLEPGGYYISYSKDSTGKDPVGGVSFTIAQFRKLAFQLTSKVADRPFTLGDDLSVAVEASYLAGGAMPGSAYSYYWTRRPEYFVPPGPEWKDHVFGPGTWEGEHTLGNGKGTLSAAGTVALSQSTASQNSSGSAYDYVVETTVTDIDRQEIATTAHVLVHPASFYLGARFASNTASGWWSRFIPTNTSTKLETVTVDPQGRPWKDPVEVTATLTLGSWKATEQQGVYGRINTRWDYVETPVSEQKLRTANGKVTWDFSVKEGGDYLLTVEAKDNLGRVAKTALRFYATGSNWVRRASETPSEIELMADKEEYFPGESARILVRSPVAEGKYLLTLEREGIYEQKIVELKGGQTLLEIPIKEEYLPVFYVALSSFTKREAPPTDYFEPDLGRPRSLFGLVGLRVSTKPVQLDVSVVPGQKAYQPGSKAQVTVKVTQNGQPVAGSEVTVLAVDRGVLDLIDYHVPSPLDFFYDPYNFPLAVHGDDSRRLLMKPVTYDTSKLTGGGGDKVNERKDFRPLALFEPFVVTDANGEARVSFDLPDSLTTYRLTAVALKGAKLGLSEGEMLVQNPLNVRTALPRRLRNRDTATAGVVLQNLSNQDQTVEVTASSDLLTLGGAATDGTVTKKVVVLASGVVELPFTLAATRAGTGKITFAVRSAVVNEDLTETVIVEQPLVKEAFATVGTLGTSDAGGPASGQEGLVIPRTIAPGFGGLILSASSSLRPYLEPALTRLLETRDSWKWRGDFAKLTASFAYVAEKTDAALVDQLLADLKARQLESGALTSSLRRPRVADALLSLLTAHLLEFADDRGYPVAEAPSLNRLLAYLATLKKDADQGPYSQAYLALVLAQGGRNDKDFTAQVEALGDKLGLGGYGLLTQTYLAAGDRTAAERVHRRSKNFVQIGTQSVDVKNTAEVADGWSSEVAELALLLKNSVELGDDAGLIQRLAGSLNRSERYWQTRNDSLWTLLGFLPLLDTQQAGSGAEVTVQAGTALVAALDLPAVAPQDQVFLGFDQAPLSQLARDTTVALTLSKTGDATVYYTSTLQYALPAETSLARDEGLEVTTRYETLDKKAVGERDLKPGETYRVRVDLSTTKRRQRLELLVPVPSGVEIVDPTFVTSGRHLEEDADESELTEDDWLWYFNTPETFALDNLMVYRWSDFAAGTRAVTFLVRATTPGIFPTPGASAQLELEPEVFGRSEGRLFVIKP